MKSRASRIALSVLNRNGEHNRSIYFSPWRMVSQAISHFFLLHFFLSFPLFLFFFLSFFLSFPLFLPLTFSCFLSFPLSLYLCMSISVCLRMPAYLLTPYLLTYLPTLKHGGALVETTRFDRRVVGSNPALAAM